MKIKLHESSIPDSPHAAEVVDFSLKQQFFIKVEPKRKERTSSMCQTDEINKKVCRNTRNLLLSSYHFNQDEQNKRRCLTRQPENYEENSVKTRINNRHPIMKSNSLLNKTYRNTIRIRNFQGYKKSNSLNTSGIMKIIDVNKTTTPHQNQDISYHTKKIKLSITGFIKPLQNPLSLTHNPSNLRQDFAKFLFSLKTPVRPPKTAVGNKRVTLDAKRRKIFSRANTILICENEKKMERHSRLFDIKNCNIEINSLVNLK